MRIQVATCYFPRLAKWHVQRALQWLDAVDVAGIDYICLEDEEPSDLAAQKKPAYLRGFTYNGRYVCGTKGEATYINLYTRDLYMCIPLPMKFLPVATLRFAFTLAHEVGHHVIARRGYIYTPAETYKPYGIYDEKKERICDRYAHDVIRKMYKNWYYKLGPFFARRLSNFFFDYGAVSWESRSYREAAHYWFCAYRLNPNNDEAAIAYHKALERVEKANKKC